MSNVLHLTAAEASLFTALPAELQGGWGVEEERVMFEDSPEQLRMRVRLLRLKHPAIDAFRERVKGVQGEEDFRKLVEETDFSSLRENEISQFFFALGPEVISRIIEAELTQVTTNEGLNDVAALAAIRHFLLVSLPSAA